MKEVLKALRPVKRRIRRNRLIRGAAAGLAAGLAAAVLLQAAAFFTPVPDRGLWAAAAAAAVTLLAALGNAARPVKNVTAAEAADACGLKERVITAIETEEDGPVRRLQRQDACEALEKLDVRKIRPGSAGKALLTALGCAVLLAALLLVPNPRDTEAAARKELTRTLQEGRKQIEQAAEEDRERLAEGKKSELRKITAELDRELESSRDAADALVALDRAEQRLEELRQQTAGDASAEAGTAGDAGTGIGAKAEGTGGQAEAGTSGTAAAGQQTDAAASAAGTAGQMKTLQALAALKNAVNPSLQAGNGSGNQGNQGWQGSGGTAGQAGTGTAGQSGGQGSQGGQNGAGGNSSDGRTGGGAGEGSTNREQQGGGNGGTIAKGNRDPRYKELEYETIYDPEHIGKERQDTQTEQFRLGDEDAAQIETGPGKGHTAGDVPWGEVLQEYTDTESRAADRENLTIRERRWVDEYYRLLTEQQ